MNTTNKPDYRRSEHEDTFDFRKVLFYYLNYWYLFIISIIACLATAHFVNTFTKPTFATYGTLLVNKNSQMGIMEIMPQAGYKNYSDDVDLNNQLVLFSSQNYIRKATEKLGNYVYYFKKGKMYDIELHKSEAPFIVNADTVNLPRSSTLFNIKLLSEKEVVISFNNGKEKVTKKFGEVINLEGYRFVLSLNNEVFKKENIDKEYYFVIQTLELSSRGYAASFRIALWEKDHTIFKVSLTGINRQNIIDFVNAIMQVYIEENLNEKNVQSIKTIEFIENQLNDIAKDLDDTESRLQSFKTNNKIFNVTSNYTNTSEKINKLTEERARIYVKIRYCHYLKKYLEEEKRLDAMIVPSVMGVEDQVMNNLVITLVDLEKQRVALDFNTAPNNSILKKINNSIRTTKEALQVNINNVLNTYKINQDDLDTRVKTYEKEIAQLPASERELISIERKFKLNDDIYNYLLEKRAEAQIKRASNTSDHEVIDEASIYTTRLLTPKSAKNYQIALVLGFLIPIGLLLLNNYFNNKVMYRTDIENLAGSSIIGFIFHSRAYSPLVVFDSPRSAIAESFRTIRTNLNFYQKSPDQQTILITSSHSGEGKTFCSINLALVFAMSNKKTLLMGFDLRKPALYKEFNVTNERGISSYLINKCTIDEIIKPTAIQNLDVITSGPIPPNPSELISSAKADDLFKELKQRYEVIIVDTSPVGIVTDASLLMRFSDTNVYMVRHKFTNKKILASIVSDFASKGIGLNIIFNDLIIRRKGLGYKYGYGYGYGIGYGYGYGFNYGYGSKYYHGYYTEEEDLEPTPWYRKII